MQLAVNSNGKLESSSRDLTQTQIVLQELSCEEIDGKRNKKRKAADNWAKEQEQHFLIFWMDKINTNPLRRYSIDNPLKRSCHFRQMSCFLVRALGALKAKDEQQCKSRFGTIRRKIKLDKLKGRKPPSYSFVDYLIERGRAIAEHCPPLQKSLAQLERIVNTDSAFMQLTKRLSDFQDQIIVKRKNNRIVGYLRELQNSKQEQE